MRSPSAYLSLFVPILILTFILTSPSCKKFAVHSSVTSTDTASIIGTWAWAYQTKKGWFDSAGPDALTPATTGISRILTFDSAGKFTIVHNDSIFEDTINYEPNYLIMTQPVLLLPAATFETDSAFYAVGFGIVGCAFTDTTTLTIQNVPYQAILTADTLLVHGDPCLSRAVDIYVRKN